MKPSILRRVRNTFTHSRRKRHGTIDMLPDGFAFTWRKRETRVPWTDVTSIDAGVRDFLTHDAMFVIVFTGQTKLQIDEFDDGFRQFESVLFERWPQVRERWTQMLESHSHEPQYETLWRRDG